MQRRIHESLHGERNILGGKRAAVGERDSTAQFESNLLTVFRYLPRFRKLRFEFLSMAIGANQHATGQITDGKGSIVIDQQRIEGLRLGTQAKAQFAAALTLHETRQETETQKSQGQRESNKV